MQPPQTRRDEDVVETLHGQRIPDPYRWLEDPDSAETAAWVTAQNEVTEAHLRSLPARDWFAKRVDDTMHRPTSNTPLVRSGRYIVARHDGRHDQPTWYVADSLAELEAGGRVLVDPNTLSADGTSAVNAITVSPDGSRLAYVRNDGGSDWAHFALLDPATGEPIDDVEIVSKFSVPVWLPDNSSYIYAAWPNERAEGTSTEANVAPQQRIHRIGSTDDELFLEFPDDPDLRGWCQTTHDGRFVVVTVLRGTERKNRVWVCRVAEKDGRSTPSEPIRLIDTVDAAYDFITNVGDRLLFKTDADAPNSRVIGIDLEQFERHGTATRTEVIAEGEHPLTEVVAAGDQLLVERLVDAQSVISRSTLDGRDLGRLDLPVGSRIWLHGTPGCPDAFAGFSTPTSRVTNWHIDLTTGATRILDLDSGHAPQAEQPQITRHRARSADGTQVPYFLITAAGSDVDGPRPTILYGYGGFDIPVKAGFQPGWSAWLEAGGAVAVANLRGGGEFGRDWYEQGKGRHKQNVFDDCIAVAEHLIESGITTSSRLVVHGRSNGGLLVGAVLTQRPDLFAAAVPGVGVMDLLRFHKFTGGAAWKSDYGDPDDPDDFAVALAYSPLHNITEGTAYPPTLVLTGDHDDRVVPLHSHKFTATLQHAQAGDAPILTRIETRGGHGMGKPTGMVVSEWADWLAFAAFHTGMTPEG